jgi:protein subunit release factor B
MHVAMSSYSREERALLDRCLATTYRASGPGGQHRNVTESAVRLFHPPSGLTVTCASHRSQYRNRREALAELRRRLEARARRRKPRIRTRPGRGQKEARLQDKRIRSRTKQLRRRVDES